MPELMVLKCPVCGAPLSPGDTQCTFCGSAIFIKADAPTLNLKHLNQTVIQEHIADFRARIRKDRYDVEAHYGLGVAYYNLGLGDEAIEELTQAAKLMPENADVQTQLAVVLFRAVEAGKQSAEQPMKERLAKALTLDPTNVEAILLRADIVRRRGDYEQALRILEPAVHRDPQRVNAKRIEILSALADQASQTGDTETFSRTIQELRTTGHEEQARELLMTAIQRQRALLGEAQATPVARRAQRNAGSTKPGKGKVFLVGFVYFVIGGLVYGAITAPFPKDAEGKLTGGANAFATVLMLAIIAVSIAAGWQYRRGRGFVGMGMVRRLVDTVTGFRTRRLIAGSSPEDGLSTETLIATERQLAARLLARRNAAQGARSGR